MILCWITAAFAAPFQMLQPAHTLPMGETEMGGAAAYYAPLQALDQGTPAISGWGRYGATDRLEVGGGAILPFSPVSFGLQVGLRGQVIGPLQDDGFHASVGLQLGAFVTEITSPQILLPVALGVRTRTVDGFVVPTIGALAAEGGALAVWSVEGGAAFKAATFPIYTSATYGSTGGFDTLSVHLGVGYNMKM
jgi:hypothetical protein